MKMTKRILTLLTCVLLCFAPATLMVGAAEAASDLGPCGHSLDNYTFVYGPIWEKEIVGTLDVCWYKVYPLAAETCDICGYQITWDIQHPQGHDFNMATFGSDGLPVGVCRTCGFDAHTYYAAKGYP